VRPTTLGVNVIVRYITRANERHELRSRLFHQIVELLRSKHIASGPLEIQAAQSTSTWSIASFNLSSPFASCKSFLPPRAQKKAKLTTDQHWLHWSSKGPRAIASLDRQWGPKMDVICFEVYKLASPEMGSPWDRRSRFLEPYAGYIENLCSIWSSALGMASRWGVRSVRRRQFSGAERGHLMQNPSFSSMFFRWSMAKVMLN